MSTMGNQDAALRRADGGPIRALVVDDEPRCRTWLEVLRRIRAEAPTVPVLFLTAKDAVEERVAGPTAGYVLTPAAGG